MLHIVQTAQALSEVSNAYQEGDQVLLVEDSVYVSHAQHPMFTILKPMDVSVLKEDALARGIFNRVSPSLCVVDFAGFVELTAAHPTSLTWN
ncbi:sulfurtransferase complex subunit TusB [Vibrio scophthalmi]|uniref:sulfurtransferase complex subunit TusB n=1 Tax=Vibrio scophthalmi TaxID=45658 RepID=UPI003EBA491F